MSSERPDRTAFVVVLTGGIASGKSAVANRFLRLDAAVIDADVIAHQLVEPNQPSLGDIVAKFGSDVIDGSGGLDRKRMRETVFNDAAARRTLESILHPRIHAAIVDEIDKTSLAYCVLVIPLFVEVRDTYEWANRILVTDVPRSIQVERLTQRPQIDSALAERILDAQTSRESRLQIADDVIDATVPIDKLDAVVDRLHVRYRRLAKR